MVNLYVLLCLAMFIQSSWWLYYVFSLPVHVVFFVGKHLLKFGQAKLELAHVLAIFGNLLIIALPLYNH